MGRRAYGGKRKNYTMMTMITLIIIIIIIIIIF